MESKFHHVHQICTLFPHIGGNEFPVCTLNLLNSSSFRAYNRDWWCPWILKNYLPLSSSCFWKVLDDTIRCKSNLDGLLWLCLRAGMWEPSLFVARRSFIIRISTWHRCTADKSLADAAFPASHLVAYRDWWRTIASSSAWGTSFSSSGIPGIPGRVPLAVWERARAEAAAQAGDLAELQPSGYLWQVRMWHITYQLQHLTI